MIVTDQGVHSEPAKQQQAESEEVGRPKRRTGLPGWLKADYWLSVAGRCYKPLDAALLRRAASGEREWAGPLPPEASLLDRKSVV